jgi:hypothetical protein
MVRVMPDEPAGQPSRSTWKIAAVLAVLIAVTGAVGAVVAAVQRPPTSSPPEPTTPPTAFPFPSVAPTPVPRGPVVGFGSSVASDPATHNVVVFGGVDSYDTTWLWDGARWSLARPLVSPRGRFDAAVAYDPVTRLVMLFGGRLGPGQIENDTWAWSGTNWHEINTGTNDLPAGEGALMAWDDATRQMVLVTPPDTNGGSETWVWAGSHWVSKSYGDLPVGAFGSGMSFDPVSRSLLFIQELPPRGARTATWQWGGSRWRKLRANIAAAPAGIALDPASGRVLLCATIPGAPAPQLWSWSGVEWVPLRDSQLPIQPEAETTDLDHGRMLIFGSLTQPNQGSPQPLEVWWWSGHGLQRLDVGTT